MGHIKEPKGVDFLIKSEPLNNDERKAISAYIVAYKARRTKKAVAKQNVKKVHPLPEGN